MAIVVRFTPRQEDFVAASLAAMQARPAVAWTSGIFFIALPWTAAVVSIVAFCMGKPVALWSILFFLVAPPLTVVGFLRIPKVLFGRSPALRGEHRYEFSEEQMSFVGPSFDNKLQWNIVTHYLSSRFGIYLFSDKVPLVSIPKRVLDRETTEQLHALFALKGLSSI